MNLLPAADLVNYDDLPFIILDSRHAFVKDGSLKFQLLQVGIDTGMWVTCTLMAPGTTTQKYKNTGQIFAFTSSGSWHYIEYPDDINCKGSYLYEPAGSVHTLHVPSSNSEDTEVNFIMNGANLNLDADNNVESVLDAATILEVYRSLCQAQHKDLSRTILGVE